MNTRIFALKISDNTVICPFKDELERYHFWVSTNIFGKTLDKITNHTHEMLKQGIGNMSVRAELENTLRNLAESFKVTKINGEIFWNFNIPMQFNFAVTMVENALNLLIETNFRYATSHKQEYQVSDADRSIHLAHDHSLAEHYPVQLSVLGDIIASRMYQKDVMA